MEFIFLAAKDQTFLHELHVLQPASSLWNVSQKRDCSYANPQESQRSAVWPARNSHPGRQLVELLVPHLTFQQTLVRTAALSCTPPCTTSNPSPASLIFFFVFSFSSSSCFFFCCCCVFAFFLFLLVGF